MAPFPHPVRRNDPSYLRGRFPAPLLCVKDEDAPFHGGSISLGGSYLPAQFKDVSLTALGAEEATFLMENPPAKAPAYLAGFTKSPAKKETQRQRERAAHVIPVPSCWIPLQAWLEDGASLQELALSYSLWYSVKKKYKLNVNFFHNTILKLRLILNSLTLSYIYLHIRLERDIHNGCVF